MSDFPTIKSTHSLVAKYVTKPIWDKLSSVKTATSGFTLGQAIACAVEFDNQHCGIYAGDWDSYKDFAEVFDPLIQEYHGISADATHTSDMDVNKIKGNVDPAAPVHSCRIRVGRSIDGFGLSPGITKEQRVGVENLMKKAFANLKGDLAGTYYPLTGMDEKVRQQLVDDHFLFVSGDPNLKIAGMERDWPEGRGIFHNKDKTFLTWVNEEDQLRIISMQMGGDVRAVFPLQSVRCTSKRCSLPAALPAVWPRRWGHQLPHWGGDARRGGHRAFNVIQLPQDLLSLISNLALVRGWRDVHKLITLLVKLVVGVQRLGLSDLFWDPLDADVLIETHVARVREAGLVRV